MITTFTIVGGASAYAPGLVSALVNQHQSLALRQVRLYDIDQERLELIARVTSKMAVAAQASFQVVPCTTLTEAVSDTDVVLNSSRPGGFECRRIDETLPLEFNAPGQETVGPGGFFFALRSVPQAMDLEQAMAKHAPGSVLLNYTNPTNIVTQALCDGGSGRVKVVGLCDQSDEDVHLLAETNGTVPEHLSFTCNGLNHGTWYTNLRLYGARFAPQIRNLGVIEKLDAEHRLRFDLSCKLNLKYPDFWPNSYLPYYTSPELFVALAKEQGVRTDTITASLPKYYEHFREEAAKERPELRMFRGTSGFGDLAFHVLKALSEPKTSTRVLNLPNGDATTLFARSTVIEARSRITSDGVFPMPASEVPAPEIALLHRLERYQHATAIASRGATQKELVSALAENPLIKSKDIARAMLERAKTAYAGKIGALA